MEEKALKILKLIQDDPDKIGRMVGGLDSVLDYLAKHGVIDQIDSTDEFWFDNELQDKLIYKQLNNSEDKLQYIRDFIKRHTFNDLQTEGDKISWDIDPNDLVKFFNNSGRNGTAADIAEKVFEDDYFEWFDPYYFEIDSLVSELDKTNRKLLAEKIIDELDGKISKEEIENRNINLLQELLDIQGSPEFLTIDTDNINEILDDEESLKYIDRISDILSNLSNAWNDAYNSVLEDEVRNLVWSGIEEMFGKAEIYDYTITQRDGNKLYRKGIKIDVTPNIVNLFMNYFGNQTHYHEIDYFGSFENMMNEYFEEESKIDFRIPDYPDHSKVVKLYNEYVEL
jgi:predicted transcriptional regulator